MIGWLNGIIRCIESDHLIVDVSGVGYMVFCPITAIGKAKIGESIQLIIDTHVREDQITLYGFNTKQEKELFKILNTVKGVGAKVALLILSHASMSDIVNAIYNKNNQLFTSISGIGPKLAQRIINELHNSNSLKNYHAGITVQQQQISEQPMVLDAISALSNLGYSNQDATHVVNKVHQEHGEAKLEDLIKISLKELVKC